MTERSSKRGRGSTRGAPIVDEAESQSALSRRLKLEQEDPYACLKLPACTRTHHPRSKGNCAGNPNCRYGLGEWKEGIWAKQPATIERLLQNPPVRVRQGWVPESGDPKRSEQEETLGSDGALSCGASSK
jgi:hypothetical protein